MEQIKLPSVVGQGKYRQIVVKREIKAPIERVWRAITRAEEIGHWWADGEIEAREGGRIRLGSEAYDPDVGPPLNGIVKVCVEPYIFEFVWHQDYPEAGLVRFDLIELDADSTQVTLIQNVPANDVIGATAGWYELIDRLGRYAETQQPVPAEPGRFAQLKAVVAEAGIG